MTVVKIRCHECDEVKSEEEIDIGAKGNICQECKRDIPDEIEEESAKSDETEVSEVAQENEEEEDEGSDDTPIESDSGNEDDEGDKDSLQETFSEQDPLDW